ncbi:MAG TPA: cytidine deaminase [Thermoanaerobaculia bacterium]|nr:cytidine deaminase [Thermoanaerobaculia bacterium]
MPENAVPPAETASAPPVDWPALVAAARAARGRAYAPYSGYRVGAALLAGDGTVHTAGNVENGIPALSACAERLAVAAAVLAGAGDFRALAVVTDSSPPARPCGLCRQTLVEFARDLPILCVNEQDEQAETTLAELFPTPFRLTEARRAP